MQVQSGWKYQAKQNSIGGLLKAMFGYNGNPSFLEVTGYILYLLILVGYHVYQQRTLPAGTVIKAQEEPPTSLTG